MDGYVDERVPDLLKEKAPAVTVQILSKDNSVRPSFRVAVPAFNSQYKGLEVRMSNASHDRFIIIDDAEFYHFWASIKDLGKSAFMFSRFEGPEIQQAMRNVWTTAWSSAKPL